MIVAITGVSGFIGRALAYHLKHSGIQVRGTSHRQQGLERVRSHLDVAAKMALTGPIPDALFQGCDCVVHCLHDFNANPLRNINGMARIRHRITQLGVKHQMFVSSHSARPDAASAYGRIKYSIEQSFLAANETVIRPGLVVGDGGLFARQRRMLLKLPVIALPEGGQAPVPCIHIDDLCRCVVLLIEQERRGAFNLFGAVQPTQKAYVRSIFKSMGKEMPPMISIPSAGLAGLSALLRNRLGLSFESLTRIETMYLNIRHDIHASDLPTLLPEHRTWDNGMPP
jgi:nucleoside-diphosphate-sugar epimerase